MFRNLYNKTISVLEFLGLTILSFSRFFTGKARYRKKDLLLVFYESGPASIGIVCLISLLVGLILAYIGSIQLEQFGGQEVKCFNVLKSVCSLSHLKKGRNYYNLINNY